MPNWIFISISAAFMFVAGRACETHPKDFWFIVWVAVMIWMGIVAFAYDSERHRRPGADGRSEDGAPDAPAESPRT